MITDVFKNKIIIAFSLLVVLSVIINVILYQTATGKLELALQEADRIKQELSQSDAISSTYAQLTDQQAALKSEYEKISELFPKEITQESALTVLKTLSNNASLNITNLSFDKVEPLESQSATFMSVKFSFKGNYRQIANFINELNTYQQKMSLKQISFTGFFSRLTGNAVVDFHGYNNSVFSLTPPSSDSLTGKQDLFQLFEKAIPFAPQDESVKASGTTTSLSPMPNGINAAALFGTTTPNYDVYIILNKESDDAPNVIIGKYKETEITADGNHTNWANVQFYEENGRFGYRYRTNDEVYPDENSVVEFTPKDRNVLRIHVFSKEISSADDKSRLMLSVYNDTTRKVQITVTGPDGKTRLMKNKFNGDVELSYE